MTPFTVSLGKFRRIASVCSKELSRYAMDAVRIVRGVLAVTDGRSLVIARTDGDRGDYAGMVSRVATDEIRIGDEAKLAIVDDGGETKIAFGRTTIVDDLDAGKTPRSRDFPPLDGIVPTALPTDTFIGVSPSLLARTLLAMSGDKNEGVRLVIRGQEKPILIVKPSEPQSLAVVMPMSMGDTTTLSPEDVAARVNEVRGGLLADFTGVPLVTTPTKAEIPAAVAKKRKGKE